MKLIPLQDGSSAIVDDHWYPFLSLFTWYASKNKVGVAYVHSMGARINKKRGKTVCMHRVVMSAVRGQSVDHINGDPLDNRECNLRIATSAQNAANKIHVVGVYYDKSRNKWVAAIKKNRKSRHLGRFDSFFEALAVRRRAELLYFGEFAPARFDNLARDVA